MDFHVFKSQLADGLGRKVDAYGTFRWDIADKAVGNAAGARFLGVVGKDYKVLQHFEGLEMLDTLVADIGGAHYETMGALGNGEKVWGLVNLGATHNIRVGADESKLHLLFATSHNGSLSFQVRLAAERVVCQNTLNVAIREGRASFTVRHTANAASRLQAAKLALSAISTETRNMSDTLNMLAGKMATRESAEKLFNRLFPVKADTEKGEPAESSTRRNNMIGAILERFEYNDGNAFPEQRGTAYNLLNAITEWTDHVRGNSVSPRARAEAALFGSGDTLKAKAYEYILADAGNLPGKYATRASSAGAQTANVEELGLL